MSVSWAGSCVLAQGVPRDLGAASGTVDLDGPELTMISWPLQVDVHTEDSDMNKRRRKGFNNPDEVCVPSVSLSKGWVPVATVLVCPSFPLS